MKQGLNLHFSVSATSRKLRGSERDGEDYYFITTEEFRKRIEEGDFLEYEEVYAGCYYGTPKSTVEKWLADGENVVFDVDVNGGLKIKEYFGDRALSLFIQPPSVDELRRRLEKRGTDAPEVIEKRIKRAQYELSRASEFDKIIVNDKLEDALAETLETVRNFIAE
jgi:guanylate kinase